MSNKLRTKILTAILFIFLLTSCGKSDLYNLVGHRRFQVGDCLIASINEPETWENQKPEFKVLELGERKYRIIRLTYPIYETDIKYGHLWEDFYQKVDCKEQK